MRGTLEPAKFPEWTLNKPNLSSNRSFASWKWGLWVEVRNSRYLQLKNDSKYPLTEAKSRSNMSHWLCQSHRYGEGKEGSPAIHVVPHILACFTARRMRLDSDFHDYILMS